VPAFVGLGAPYWDAEARGAIYGLTRNTGPAEIARATLESVAYQTQDLIAAMHKDWKGVKSKTVLRVDGGMVVNDLLMQFQSDILQVPVIRPKMIETTALGAAYAAGLAVGYWSGPKDLKRNWSMDKTWKPEMPQDKRNQFYMYWNKALDRALDWDEN
jgi:glycerol kinase